MNNSIRTLWAAMASLPLLAVAQSSTAYCRGDADCIRREQSYQSSVNDIRSRPSAQSDRDRSWGWVELAMERRRAQAQANNRPRYNDVWSPNAMDPKEWWALYGNSGGSNSRSSAAALPPPPPPPLEHASLAGIKADLLARRDVPLTDYLQRIYFTQHVLTQRLNAAARSEPQRPLPQTPDWARGNYMSIATGRGTEKAYLELGTANSFLQTPVMENLANTADNRLLLGHLSSRIQERGATLAGWRFDFCAVDPSKVCAFRAFPAATSHEVTAMADYMTEGQLTQGLAAARSALQSYFAATPKP